MADSKVSALASLTGASVATDDFFLVVDKSDTTMAASGTDKQITADETRKALARLGLVAADSVWDAKGDLVAGTAADTAAKLTVGANGTHLVADSTQTTGLVWKQRSRIVTDNHTDSSAVNTTSETVVATVAVPTTVEAGDLLRFVAVGDMLNNTGGGVNFTFKSILGATTVLTTPATSLATGANRRQWRLSGEVLANATNDERLNFNLFITNAASTGWVGGAGAQFQARGTATEDLTAGKNLQLSVTMGTASASADFVCHESWLELVKR